MQKNTNISGTDSLLFGEKIRQISGKKNGFDTLQLGF